MMASTAQAPYNQATFPFMLPSHRFEHETPRGFMRRQQNTQTVLLSRLHKSTSLDDSRDWYEREVREQLSRGELFNDPFMPAVDSTIKKSLMFHAGQYDWLRPHELTHDPKFIIDGISRFDIRQGEIGDCWFLAAMSSLSMHPDLLEQVVPSGQSFDPSPKETRCSYPYCGMFWFRFWQFGDWYDVVIDDRLPTQNGRLIFLHSSDRNEFWSALLEKAYVKLFGTYEAMRGGSAAEAMEDFTGGLTELVDLGLKTPENLFTMMERAHSRASLMACSIDANPDLVEAEGPFGLIMGHAYSVTAVCRLTSGQNLVELVRLRNPWGNDREWYGPWSDGSAEWKSIPSSERKRIGLVFENDGEFWMSFSDFIRYFSRLEFCHLGPESGCFGRSFKQDERKRRWEMTREEGEWIRHSTAGGCRNYARTFHMNPQFRVQVIDPDETDDDNTGTIIVGLMQKGRRETFQEHHTIGYSIYRLPGRDFPRDRLLPQEFFLRTSSVTRSPAFINMREIFGRHKLEPGEYVIIPSTFEPNQEAKFLLRIFSERACESNEMDDTTSIAADSTLPAPENVIQDESTEKLREAFNDVAGGLGEITAHELRDILNAAFIKDFPFDGFSCETARSMVALMDADLNGSLGFDEFSKLWQDLRIWKSMFKIYDHDQNGTFDAFELRDLMRALGFHVSNRVYTAIISRYANHQGRILFDDYILLLVRLVTVYDTYKAQEHLTDGRAVFALEDFVRSVIYI
ncbi:Calpain-2 catalytic subunit [Fasciola hepatica]|uniref:Calpain-2 catalytic subunit n=1 Tax=Fasciola hepatica TaxID=6192 RepID=A0A4E0RSV5_FASHE|nr:Calpain-2 catalytic subunit [Fasciola hepatica]